MEEIRISPEIRRLLEREIPFLTAEIRAVYGQLDKKYHLQGARIPITFGFETDLLGSYTPKSIGEKEHFHFSLLFIGHAVPNPLGRAERQDLFRHEYAHYMVSHIDIPEKYRWQAGKHGSAWKYCCSLVQAAPTPYYKAGEALMPHDYEKAMTKKVRTAQTVMLDTWHQEQSYRDQKNSIVRFAPGDTIHHPSFGDGIVREIRQQTGSVRLVADFACGQKIIDQQWLLRLGYHRAGDL